MDILQIFKRIRHTIYKWFWNIFGSGVWTQEELNEAEVGAERLADLIESPNFILHSPKRQPCPECGSWAKRIRKGIGGSKYYCKKDNLFYYCNTRRVLTPE